MAENGTTKGNQALNKTGLIQKLADSSELTKQQASAVLDNLRNVIVQELKQNGVITIPGLLKLRMVHKPATGERKNINPATKLPMIVPPKPACSVLKAVLLKALKDDTLPQSTPSANAQS